jgi:hypothetical protein
MQLAEGLHAVSPFRLYYRKIYYHKYKGVVKRFSAFAEKFAALTQSCERQTADGTAAPSGGNPPVDKPGKI